METAIVSIVCIALIVFGGMTMSRGFISSVDSTALAMDKMEQRNEKILRTELSPDDTWMTSSTVLRVTLRNSGQTKLTDFDKWDVIVEHIDDDDSRWVTWLPYVEGSPGNNQWRKYAIYLDGSTEVYEPNILNPGEEIDIQARLSPAVKNNTINRVTISTPNGIPVTTTFTR